jgi:hypothetical protein
MVISISTLCRLDKAETGGAFGGLKKRHLWRKFFVKE